MSLAGLAPFTDVFTGNSVSGAGGNIAVAVGWGYKGQGGSVSISAGDTIESTFAGGTVSVSGGSGTSTMFPGGFGGPVVISGGQASGGNGLANGRPALSPEDVPNGELIVADALLQEDLFLFSAAGRILERVETSTLSLVSVCKQPVEA